MFIKFLLDLKNESPSLPDIIFREDREKELKEERELKEKEAKAKALKEEKLKDFNLEYGHTFHWDKKYGSIHSGVEYSFSTYSRETKDLHMYTAFDVWNFINMPDLSQFSLEDIDLFIRKIIKNLDRFPKTQNKYLRLEICQMRYDETRFRHESIPILDTLLNMLTYLKGKKGGDKSILCLYAYLSQKMKSMEKGNKHYHIPYVRENNSKRVIEKEAKEKEEKEKRHEERKIRVLRKMERLIDKGVNVEKIQDLV